MHLALPVLRFRWLAMSASLLVIAGAMVAEGDDKAAASKTPVARPKPAAPADLTTEEETAALEFARKHHQELARLLEPMKASHEKEYQRAVRELARAAERLERMEARIPERYAIELDLWKAESRLRLVAAKSVMVDDDERRERIEELVSQRNALKIKLFEYERKEAAERIEQLDQQIAALKAQQESGLSKEVDRLVKTAKSTAKKVKTKAERPEAVSQPAAKPKT